MLPDQILINNRLGSKNVNIQNHPPGSIYPLRWLHCLDQIDAIRVSRNHQRILVQKPLKGNIHSARGLGRVFQEILKLHFIL